jgi:plasmid maintenance system killer protein
MRPAGYDAAKAALVNAINGKRLVAKVVDWLDENGYSQGPDWHHTTIMVEDLQAWLKSRGISMVEDLRNPPGNRLEVLKGDRAGQMSIRINDQWRICFRWFKGDADDVEIVDYHS